VYNDDEYRKTVEQADKDLFVIEYIPKEECVPLVYRGRLAWREIRHPKFDWETKNYRIAEPKRKIRPIHTAKIDMNDWLGT